jgi:hypothetical protein
MPVANDITGQRFGYLTAIERFDAKRWLFRCDCGSEKPIDKYHVVHLLVKSCTCKRPGLVSSSRPRHSREQKLLRKLWGQMHRRCTNTKDTRWSSYGGRGIRVCERWQNFENFVADMGPRPPGASLDRHPNNDGNYEPGNVRWATATEQSNNRRSNRKITHNGESLSLREWERRTGIPWASVEQALTTKTMSASEAGRYHSQRKESNSSSPSS